MIQLVEDRSLQSPAAIYHDGKCSRVLVNPDWFYSLPADQQAFIIEHELAHCKHDTRSEFAADKIGLKNFIRKGGDPQSAYQALAENLGNSREHQKRKQAMFKKVYTPSQFNGDDYSDEPWLYGDSTLPDYGYSTGQQQQRNSWDAGDWNDLLDTAAEVAIALFGKGYRPSSGNYPQGAPTSSGISTTTILIVVAVIVLIILVFAYKK